MSDRFTTVVAGVVILGLAACVTVLAWHGTINGQAAIGFFSGLSLSAIVGGVQHAATRSALRSMGANAKS